jgi:ribosomal peptide maturation radical SAM protein 1
MKRMPVLLVSMPWEDLKYPSIQLGILLEVLRDAGINAATRSMKFDFMEQCISATAACPEGERLGVAEYRTIVEWSRHVSLGDWIFTVPPFRRPDAALDAEYIAFLRAFPVPAAVIDVAMRFRALSASFLERCADWIVAQTPAVVGFTSAFNQSASSLGLARILKARAPEIAIVFGGANCQGAMGAALLRAFPEVDVVVRGEGEIVLPALVHDLVAGGPIRRQPGLCYRDDDRIVVVPEADGPTVPMTDVPVPCYDEYFERLEGASFAADLAPSLTLFYEGSRGCWWGEKSQCTFCGISSLTMPFRSKPSDRVVDELLGLARRYQRLDFLVVDYIMDLRYLDDVMPRLRDAGFDLRLFFEMKANIRREHVQLLRESGVATMQSGIESLSTPILKLMKKGVTAFQNIRLLKWCAEYGIRLHWNFLYGLPGEPVDEYRRVADVMRSLTHLEPPEIIRLQLDRFSPYHEQPEAFGIEPLGPRRDFRFIYQVDADILNDLVYSFEYRHADGRDPDVYAQEVRDVIESWREHGRTAIGTLSYRRGPGFLLVTDRRPGLAPAEYRFDETEALLYLACEDGLTAKRAQRAVDAAGVDVDLDDVIAFLNDLVERRLMFEEGSRYLSLALPSSPSTRPRTSAPEDPIRESFVAIGEIART